jgi:hypothetical protein
LTPAQAADGPEQAGRSATGGGRSLRHDPHYKWVALSNTTLGVLMSAIDGSIVIISLPAIFKEIGRAHV